MGRLRWLVAGTVLGAVGMFVSMKYHVVRAQDGVHWIPKATADLTIPYVDIREFGVSDWDERRDLTLAIVQAEKSHLLQDAAFSGLRHTMENVMDSMQGSSAGLR